MCSSSSSYRISLLFLCFFFYQFPHYHLYPIIITAVAILQSIIFSCSWSLSLFSSLSFSPSSAWPSFFQLSFFHLALLVSSSAASRFSLIPLIFILHHIFLITSFVLLQPKHLKISSILSVSFSIILSCLFSLLQPLHLFFYTCFSFRTPLLITGLASLASTSPENNKHYERHLFSKFASFISCSFSIYYFHPSFCSS